MVLRAAGSPRSLLRASRAPGALEAMVGASCILATVSTLQPKYPVLQQAARFACGTVVWNRVTAEEEN